MLLRRARGVFVTGLLWAIVWGILGCAVVLTQVISQSRPSEPSLARLILVALTFFGVWGGVSGSVFAIALTVAERQRSIEELSMGRVALWGAIGGATIPAIGTAASVLAGAASRLQPDLAWLFAITALLGSLCASATLALARRGEAAVDVVH